MAENGGWICFGYLYTKSQQGYNSGLEAKLVEV
jgi:hypothetical protein